MKLLRKNIDKQREVYLLDNCIRKVWNISKKDWVLAHFTLLEERLPGYAIGTGTNDNCIWIDYNILEGTLASTFKHSPEFINRIYNFCIKNIEDTYPYAHGDWSLSNMLINGDAINMCDWDNLGIYSKEQVYKKLHQDLFDSFGDAFTKLIK